MAAKNSTPGPEDFITVMNSPSISRSSPNPKTESNQSFADIEDGDCPLDSPLSDLQIDQSPQPETDQKQRVYSLLPAKSKKKDEWQKGAKEEKRNGEEKPPKHDQKTEAKDKGDRA